MPDDAKLGLVAGVAAVVLGAVIYLPKPPASPEPPVASAPALPPPPQLEPPIIPAPRPEVAGIAASFAKGPGR